MKFLAIDFETANYYRHSACAIGLVKVVECQVKDRQYHLIRPPHKWFMFTGIHGISWEDVKSEPTFAELWPRIQRQFCGVDFLVAHNAAFDRSVLRALCQMYDIPMPQIEFKCTMKLAREIWGIYPSSLPSVCDHFGIPLVHHNALSDTEACAQIMILALDHLSD